LKLWFLDRSIKFPNGNPELKSDVEYMLSVITWKLEFKEAKTFSTCECKVGLLNVSLFSHSIYHHRSKMAMTTTDFIGSYEFSVLP
jgi:hypothetical protein